MRFFDNNNSPSILEDVNSDNLIVCLDIDTHEIRATLISMSETIKVIGYSQQLLNFQNSTNYLSNLTGLKKVVSQVISRASARQDLPLKYLVIGLGGNLIQSVTYLSRVRRLDKTAPFSKKELNRLINQNQLEAANVALEQMKFNNQINNIGVKLLNSSLVGFNLDGVPLDDPIGQIGSSVGASLYNVFIANQWYEAVEKLSESLNLELVSLTYKPFALAQGVLGDSSSGLNTLIIHMETSVTYVILISDGVLVKTEVFNLGEANFNLALCRNLNLDYKKVIGLRDVDGDFSFASLDSHLQGQAMKVINHTIAIWLRGLIISFKEINLAKLPPNIYLSGKAGDYKNILQNLQKVDFTGIITLSDYRTKFEVLNLNHMYKVDIKADKRLAFSCVSMGIGLGRLSYNILEASGNLSKLNK